MNTTVSKQSLNALAALAFRGLQYAGDKDAKPEYNLDGGVDDTLLDLIRREKKPEATRSVCQRLPTGYRVRPRRRRGDRNPRPRSPRHVQSNRKRVEERGPPIGRRCRRRRLSSHSMCRHIRGPRVARGAYPLHQQSRSTTRGFNQVAKANRRNAVNLHASR